MNTPRPPFRSVSEELLYNIYLKVSNSETGNGITPNDIDTLAKLNSFLTDAVLMKADDIMFAINALKGNVPVNGNTLEKLYNLVQGFSFLKREDIDTIGELNALITDGDLVRVEDLADLLIGLNLKRRAFQFFFSGDWNDHENYNHYHDRDMFVLRGKINSLSQDFTNELSSVTYKSRLDISSSWAVHTNLSSLQTWISNNIAGDEQTGTKYWIKCVPIYKQGHDEVAVNVLTFTV